MIIMEKRATPLVDEHLESLKGMQEANTDEFFYTRLFARMENGTNIGWQLPIQPVWILSVLIFFLGINSFMLSKEFKVRPVNEKTENTSIQSFAEAYDQTFHSIY